MLKSELLTIINQGEGAKIEFKRDNIRAEGLAKEIVAFANMNGGIILIGIEDNGDVSGIQRENLHEWLMDTVVGKHIHPFILPDYEELNHQNKKIAVVTIPMGNAKPYVLKHNGREDIYIRYGNTCQLAKREQQARLFDAGGLSSAEKFPVHGSGIDELDDRRYKEYFTKFLEVPDMENWHEFLINRSFLVSTGNSLHCSYLSYAMFAKDPQRKLPQSGVRVTVYSGNDKDYSTLADETLSLPLVAFCGNHSDREPIEMALHDKVIDILQLHISREKLDKTTRKRYWDYLPEVLRELLVNAFVHRDWTKQNYVRVIVYSDRLEVISPGALPNGLTVEKIKYGEQSQRNPACIRIFRDYGYLEDQGMGIRCKVIPLTLEHNGIDAEFTPTEEQFKVTLWKKKSN